MINEESVGIGHTVKLLKPINESKVSSTYEISYDYGPHMSKTVSISANSEKEAEKEVIRTAAKEGHRNIMINWIRKDARQSIQRGTNAK